MGEPGDADYDLLSPKILPLSVSCKPNAKMIFLLVSRRQLFPFSMRSMVSAEIPAFRANSALLINSLSRYFRREFISDL